MSFKDSDYKIVHGQESYGNLGGFGVRVMVATTRPDIDLKADPLNMVAWKAVDAIFEEVGAQAIQHEPEYLENAADQKARLLALFPQPIFAKAIPNGYCPRYCCRHLPWFIVTTPIGHFTIGWRKRVIQIDWSETLCLKTAEFLFPLDDVTKSDRMIHAWSYEKAAEYIATILATGEGK